MDRYMDDLVDCFEEFVKKSMLVVSVAVGTLVLVVMYVFKVMTERAIGRQIADDPVETVCVDNTSQVSNQQLPKITTKSMEPFMNDYLPVASTRSISLQITPITYPSLAPSYAESFIKEIDLGINSKIFDTCKQTQVSDDLKSASPGTGFLRTRQSCESKSYYIRTRPGKMPTNILQGSAVVLAPVVTMYRDWELLSKAAQSYIWTAYCVMSGNYIAVVTVVLVLILSLMLPDITQKLHAAQDLKTMKKVLDKMTNEVKRAEVACLTVADEITYLQRNIKDDTTETLKGKPLDISASTSRSMHVTKSEPARYDKKGNLVRRAFCQNRNTSNKEVTIMSYVYTDSFDDTNKTVQEQQDIQE